MQQFFNPIANILAASDESKRGDKPLIARNNHSSSSNISKMICWYCPKDHKVTVCERFISLNLSKKNNFVGIVCRRDTKLRTVRQPQNVQILAIKKITLLHDPSVKPVNLSNPVNPITNPSKENIQNHVLFSAFTNSAFMQIIPVILKSGETCIRTNASLDTD